MRAVLFFIAASAGVSYAAGRFEFEQPHMGTKVRIVFYAADQAKADAAAKAAFQRIAAIEQVLSDYKSDSEVMKLCAANDKMPDEDYAISDDLRKVMKTSQEISKKSDGAFDVTIGPLSKLWRETRKTKTLPDAKTLAEAKAKVGYESLILKDKSLRLKKPGMRLDFGGIGKGYAADEALVVLKKAGIDSALVAVSGDIAVSDAPPGRDGWVVDIAPLDPKDPSRKLLLENLAVSTSGDLFQHVEIEGVRYSHVLDPKTGLGLTGLRSATVIAKDGIHADALSKVASIMPASEALKVIESYQGSAFIAVKGEKPVESSTFKSYIQ